MTGRFGWWILKATNLFEQKSLGFDGRDKNASAARAKVDGDVEGFGADQHSHNSRSSCTFVCGTFFSLTLPVAARAICAHWINRAAGTFAGDRKNRRYVSG